MAHRKEPSNRNRGVSKRAVANDPIAEMLPNLAEFLDDGEITLGLLEPVGCVAVAADGHNSLAMLVRLDQAIGLALAEDIFTDEING